MTDYAALKQEIGTHPELSDAEIVALLNEVTTQRKPIAATEIRKLWSRWMVLAKCWLASEKTELPDDVRVVCRATYDNLLWDVFTDLDPTDDTQAADINTYLQALIAVGALTPKQKDATLALGTFQASWAQLHGWPHGLEAGEIPAARKWNG